MTAFSFDHDQLRRASAEQLMRWLFGAPRVRQSAPMPRQGIHRILICHISHTLGNALLLTPLLCELERLYPGAEIDIVTRCGVAEAIYRPYFSVRRIFQLPAHAVRHPWQFLEQWRAVREAHYDLVIDPDPKSQTGRLFLLHARATWTLGFETPKKSGKMSHGIPIEAVPTSIGQRGVWLLRQACAENAALEVPPPDLRLSVAERVAGRAALARLLAAHGIDAVKPVLGIFANASGPKLLGYETWWQPFIQTIRAQRPDLCIVEIVPAFARALLGEQYPSYFSSDLRKLASVLAALDAYSSADCGVMHLANATGVPTFGIFTTWLADTWGPYGAGHHAIRAEQLSPADAAREVLHRLP